MSILLAFMYCEVPRMHLEENRILHDIYTDGKSSRLEALLLYVSTLSGAMDRICASYDYPVVLLGAHLFGVHSMYEGIKYTL